MPLLPLRGMMVFPYMIIHLDVGRERSVAALEQAMVQDRRIFWRLSGMQMWMHRGRNIYEIGTIAGIRQLVKLPGGTIRVLVEGLHRARMLSYAELESYVEVELEEHKDAIDSSMEMEGLNRAVIHAFEKWVKLSKKMPAETMVSVAIIDDAGRLGDLIANPLESQAGGKAGVARAGGCTGPAGKT